MLDHPAKALSVAGYTVSLLAWTAALLWSSTVAGLGNEDGLIESTGALLFLLAAAMCWTAAVLSHRAKVSRLYVMWLALLGLLLFVCFGEEISWGQRIFDIQTPESIRHLNAQGELNIHNFWLFYSRHPDGTWKTGLSNLSMTRLFSVFWLVYCVLIPICYGWLASLRTLIIGAAIPLVPVALGCVFAASFVMFRVVVMLRPEHSGNLSELKEALYALAFALVASYFLFDARRRQWRSLPRAVV